MEAVVEPVCGNVNVLGNRFNILCQKVIECPKRQCAEAHNGLIRWILLVVTASLC